jgi:hypothetical protein
MTKPEATSFKVNKLFVLLILMTALCLHRLPALELFSTHLLGGTGPDTNLYFWLVTSFPANLLQYGWFETNAFHPYHSTLAWSDCFLLPSCLFYFFRLIGLSEIPAWNLLILLAQLLNVFCVFILAHKISLKAVPSFLISLIFIGSPYFSEHLGHPQLQFFFFIPLALFYFFGILSDSDSQANKSSTKVLFAITLAASFYTSAYYSIIICLLCFLILMAKLLNDHKLFKAISIELSLSAAIAVPLMLPALIPYLQVKKDFGARGLHEFYHFSVEASSFLSPSALSDLYSKNLLQSHSEANMFWGLACLFLLILSLKNLKLTPLLSFLLALLLSQPLLLGLTREVRLYACAFFACFSFASVVLILLREKITTVSICSYVGVLLILIALGPLGYSEIEVTALGPFNLFYNFFPGIDSLRAISRLTSAAILLLLIGSTESLAKLGLRSLVLLPLIYVDSLVSSFPLAPLQQKPAIFEELRKRVAAGQSSLIAPLSGKLDNNRNIISWKEVATLNSQYLVDLRDNPIKVLNGYSGQRPKSIYELPKILAIFPDSKSLDLLSNYEDLKWIVMLGSKIDDFNQDAFLAKIYLVSDRIKVRAQIGNDFLLELHFQKNAEE